MTQRQLADLATVSVRAIRDIERGRALRPRPDTVRLLASGLGLSGRGRSDFEAAAGRPTITDLRDLVQGAVPAPPPAPLDGLIGREAEVAALQGLLSQGGQRLVTIIGMGSVGKTRVALEAAGILYASGGYPVLWSSASRDTSTNNDPRSAHQAGLGELLTQPDGDVSELGALIGGRPALLVLDGYGAGQIRADRIVPLLQECRGLRVLATSRTPLQITGERKLVLSPLPVPDPSWDREPGSLAAVESVQLLLRHVKRAQPAFELTPVTSPAVAELCRCLDGIPCALEAVASWFPMYAVVDLLRYVRSDPFGFLEQADIPDAIGMRDALREAVGALSDEEMALLARLEELDTCWSTLDAARVAPGSPSACAGVIQRLLTRGIVRPASHQDHSRFQVLNLVRALAHE